MPTVDDRDPMGAQRYPLVRDGYLLRTTMKVIELFDVTFSPGTGSTLASTRRGTPVGGAGWSGITAEAVLPALVWSSVLVPVIGVPEPLTVRSTLTPVSSLEP